MGREGRRGGGGGGGGGVGALHTCSSVSGSQYKQGVVLVFLNRLSSRLPGFF